MMRIRSIITHLLCCACLAGAAQVNVDRPVQLIGTVDSDKQVHDLKDATTNADALNARRLRAAGYGYADVLGTGSWAVHLDPAITQVNPGLRLVLHSIDGNAGPVTMTVDGSIPYHLMKGEGQELVAGDVLPGEEVGAVFDGISFQIISSRKWAPRPCPSGSVAVNADFCMETAERDTVYFPEASVICGQQNGQLCTWSQWWVACFNGTTLGLQSMVGDWEWTNSAANSDIQVRVVGATSCTHAGVTNGWDLVKFGFRCCYRR